MPAFLYTFAFHEDERFLCEMELRALFGADVELQDRRSLFSDKDISPSRSPFIKERITIRHEAGNPQEIAEHAGLIRLDESTFKVIYVKTEEAVPYEDRRAAERVIGLEISGKAEMRTPDIVFGVAKAGDRWVFGDYAVNEAVWLAHQDKVQNYSTALSTRLARAVTNIAVPDPMGIKAIDPCCGIGTVLIEALSMGIDIVGFDINWLAVNGARLNLQHFGYPDVVKVADMRQLAGRYDAAIFDLPYNLCSKLPDEEKNQMLRSVKQLAKRIVLLSTEPILEAIERAGLEVLDRCVIHKGSFTRELFLCTS